MLRFQMGPRVGTEGPVAESLIKVLDRLGEVVLVERAIACLLEVRGLAGSPSGVWQERQGQKAD